MSVLQTWKIYRTCRTLSVALHKPETNLPYLYGAFCKNKGLRWILLHPPNPREFFAKWRTPKKPIRFPEQQQLLSIPWLACWYQKHVRLQYSRCLTVPVEFWRIPPHFLYKGFMMFPSIRGGDRRMFSMNILGCFQLPLTKQLSFPSCRRGWLRPEPGPGTLTVLRGKVTGYTKYDLPSKCCFVGETDHGFPSNLSTRALVKTGGLQQHFLSEKTISHM